MIIKRLELSNFRNHVSLQLSCNRNFMFFSGPNGSGKSNILEAVFFLSYAKSFRTNIAGHLVQHGCDVSLVSAEYEDDIGLEHTMLASIGKKKRFLLMTRKSKTFLQFSGCFSLSSFYKMTMF